MDNLNDFTRKVSNNNIKDKYGESMHSSMAFLMMTAISKNFPDLAYRYSNTFGSVFYHECIDEKDLSFIEELFDYTKVSMHCLYNGDNFKHFSYDMKVKSLQGLIKEISDDLLDQSSITYKCEKLANILKDDDIKSFLKREYEPTSTNLENLMKQIDEKYPMSSSILDDEIIPNEILELIIAVEQLSVIETEKEEIEPVL